MENREETNERQEFRKKLGNRCVLKSQHDSPSPEGSLIRLLAGLLTLASSDWPPSQSRRAGSVALLGQPSTITVAGPSRIRTGFPIKFPKATPEATTQIVLRLQQYLSQPLGQNIIACNSRVRLLEQGVESQD
jgi:hypothetical protein